MKKIKQIEGVIEISKSGHAYLLSENKYFNTDVFIHKSNLGKALDGDRVFVDILPGEREGVPQGQVKGIINRKRMDFSGVLELNPDKDYGFVRTSGYKMPVDFFVTINKDCKAKNGDVVVVKLVKWKVKDKSPIGKIIKILGQSESHEAEIGEIIYRHGVEQEFPEEVEKEASLIPNEISEEEISKRLDMRDKKTFTIDSKTARDLDDALSFSVLDNGNYEIGVHIADIGHYVKRGSEIDKEALKRGTSIYLVDRVLPMLPKKLSNNLASLNPNTDKLTVSTIFEISPNGEVLNYKFEKTIINSNYRFTYDEVQNIIENGSGIMWENYVDEPPFPDLINAILTLDRVAKIIRRKRFENNSIYFNSREPFFILDENKVPIEVKFNVLKDSNQLIEEFMLLTNRYVGSFLYKNKIPTAFRVHDLPNSEKLLELSILAKKFGYDFKSEGDVEEVKKSLNNLLLAVKDTPEENMISTLAVRCLSKAKVNPINSGHYGLGKDFVPPNAYAWFTSGIRRYADIINQRQLFDFLEKSK